MPEADHEATSVQTVRFMPRWEYHMLWQSCGHCGSLGLFSGELESPETYMRDAYKRALQTQIYIYPGVYLFE